MTIRLPHLPLSLLLGLATGCASLAAADAVVPETPPDLPPVAAPTPPAPADPAPPKDPPVPPAPKDPPVDPPPVTPEVTRQAVPGNAIVLRVDRYTFTEADIANTEINYHPFDTEELAERRQELALGRAEVTARMVRELARKLEKKAIGTLVSNTMMTEAVDADVFQGYKHSLAENYDRELLDQFGTFEQYMSRRNWTKADVDNERQRVVAQQLRYLIIEQLIPQVNSVTTKDMQDYYANNQSQFTREKGYRIRLIMIDKAVHHEEEGLYRFTRNIRQEYLDGASFEDLAHKYSDNAETKAQGGLWICKPLHPLPFGSGDANDEEFVTESTGRPRNNLWFSTAAGLDPTQREKQISNVVELEGPDKGSYVLLFLDSTRPAKLFEYKDVPRKFLIDLTKRSKADQLARKWTLDKLDNSRIEYRGEVVPFSEFWSDTAP